jgi:CO/xanthine dehydrogenase FAD-binding subunit
MRFEYIAPKDLGETLSVLSEYGKKARVIAGGTDLLMQMKGNLKKPDYVVDIGGIPELSYIDFNERLGLRVGAATTVRGLETSALLKEKYPVISESARQLGSIAIRNVATLGGNLCNASPSAEMAPALLGLSAKVKIAKRDGERVIPLDGFFVGPGETVLEDGELLTEIQVPPALNKSAGVYLSHTTRGSIDLSIASVAAIISLSGNSCHDIKLALGAVAPTPMRARKAEEVMRGQEFTEDLIQATAKIAADESLPIADVRASSDYRKHLVRVLVFRAIEQAVLNFKKNVA